MIVHSLEEFSGEILSAKPRANDRIETAADHFAKLSFSRKDHKLLYKVISTATASRDLAHGLLIGALEIN